MGRARPTARPVSPWTQRVVDAIPWPPLAVGAVIALAPLVAFFLVLLALGRVGPMLAGEVPAWIFEDLRVTVFVSLTIGYLVAAHAHLVRGARRDLAELRPVLRYDATEFSRLSASVGRFDPIGFRLAGLLGIALGLAIPTIAEPGEPHYDFRHVVPETAALRILVPVMLWLVVRFFYATLTESARMSRLGRDRLELDLTDLAPLAPLTRFGLRNALVAMGLLAVLSLLLIDLEAAPHQERVLAPGLAAALLLGAAGLVLPWRGLHTALVEAKRAELAWCGQALHGARDALRSGGSDHGRLASLLAYRQLIETVREWPLDAPTLSRFALYLGIPLGSWLGGAMVERLLDHLLD